MDSSTATSSLPCLARYQISRHSQIWSSLFDMEILLSGACEKRLWPYIQFCQSTIFVGLCSTLTTLIKAVHIQDSRQEGRNGVPETSEELNICCGPLLLSGNKRASYISHNRVVFAVWNALPNKAMFTMVQYNGWQIGPEADHVTLSPPCAAVCPITN